MNGEKCRACNGKRNVEPSTSSASASSEAHEPLAAEFLLCRACRKFYFRNKKVIQGQYCNGEHSSEQDFTCKICRFKVCEKIYENRRLIKSSNQVNNSDVSNYFQKIPCAVCGLASNGCHFGAICCEGCKGFFRRSMNGKYKMKYECRNEKSAQLCPPKSNCRKCRLERCHAAGMSKRAIEKGRCSVIKRAVLEQKASQISPTEKCSKVGSDVASSGSVSEQDLSPEFIIINSVKASALLAQISSVKLVFTPEMSTEELMGVRNQGLDKFIEAEASFVRALPGVDHFISLTDRKVLFSIALTPILVAQLSLDFDVANQKVNFCGANDEQSLKLLARIIPEAQTISKYLLEAGNAFAQNISDLTEFALFAALLFLNHENDQLEDRESVAKLRQLYISALLGHIHVSVKTDSETKMANFFRMLKLFREGNRILFISNMKLRQLFPVIARWKSPLMAEIHSYLYRNASLIHELEKSRSSLTS